MELTLGKTYYLNIGFGKKNKWTLVALTVYVESRSGRFDTESGKIIPVDNLDSAVEDAIDELKNKHLDDVKGLAYLPHTLEMLATRLWDRIEDTLGYKLNLSKLHLESDDHFFVEYVGKANNREPQSKYKKAKRKSDGN